MPQFVWVLPWEDADVIFLGTDSREFTDLTAQSDNLVQT